MTRIGAVLALAMLAAGCGGSGSASTTKSAPSAVTTTGASSTATTTSVRTHATATTTSTTSSATTTTASTSAATTSTTTTATASSTASATTTTTATRTETGPAFVGGGGLGGGALAAASALLARHGFVAASSATYGPADTLHVLIGRAGAGGERAFFFDEGTFIGTDSGVQSAHIAVVAHSDSEVTLAYDVYAAGARTPSGRRSVIFALDMGRLAALSPLPSVAERR